MVYQTERGPERERSAIAESGVETILAKWGGRDGGGRRANPSLRKAQTRYRTTRKRTVISKFAQREGLHALGVPRVARDRPTHEDYRWAPTPTWTGDLSLEWVPQHGPALRHLSVVLG